MLFSKEIFFVVVNLAFFPITFSESGEPTSISIREAPYIAAIYSNDKFVCTGTILNKRNILTAADCMTDLVITEICIKVGQEDVNDDPEQCVRATNNEIINENGVDRITVIDLEDPLIFSETISNIDLASGEDFEAALKEESIEASTVGWSCSKETLSCRLEKSDMLILPTEVCTEEPDKYFSDIDRTFFNETTHFCFSTMDREYAWKFYGSPLVVNEKLGGIKILNTYDENSLYVSMTHFADYLNELEKEAGTIPIPEDVEEKIPGKEEATAGEERLAPGEEKPTTIISSSETTESHPTKTTSTLLTPTTTTIISSSETTESHPTYTTSTLLTPTTTTIISSSIKRRSRPTKMTSTRSTPTTTRIISSTIKTRSRPTKMTSTRSTPTTISSSNISALGLLEQIMNVLQQITDKLTKRFEISKELLLYLIKYSAAQNKKGFRGKKKRPVY